MRKYFPLVLLFIIAALAIVGHAQSVIPAVGTPAPSFKLISNEGKKTSLSDYKGKWVVLYLCPTTFGERCRLQARSFQRDLKKYEQANAVILGIGVESVEVNRAFSIKEGLSFNLLSDPGSKVAESYGSAFGPKGNRYGSVQNTFFIDPKGKIAKVFLDTPPPSEQVLAALTEIQKGC